MTWLAIILCRSIKIGNCYLRKVNKFVTRYTIHCLCHINMLKYYNIICRVHGDTLYKNLPSRRTNCFKWGGIYEKYNFIYTITSPSLEHLGLYLGIDTTHFAYIKFGCIWWLYGNNGESLRLVFLFRKGNRDGRV